MNNRRNYYRLLQVQPDAPLEVIRASYRTLMLQLKQHPDLGGEQWNAAILNEAYATLSDRNKRAEYNKTLFEHYTREPFPPKNIKKKPVISIFCPFCKRPLARESQPGECCPTCKCPLHQEEAGESFKRDYRRSFLRMKKAGKLRYYSFWPQKGKEGKILDLSPKGIRFTCSERLKQGLTIKISSPLLKATAKVKSSQEKKINGEIFYAVGAEFLIVNFTEPRGSFFSAVV